PCLAPLPFRDLEYALLGEIDELLDGAAFGIVRARGDVAADLYQLSQQRAVADDPRVGTNIGRARRVLDELCEVAETARSLELPLPAELLADRHGVRRLVQVDELGDRAEDQAVIGAVEMLRGDDVRDLIPRALVEQQAAEQRLLGLDRVR